MEFEWDASKEEENVRKHGVWFYDSVESFFDPQGIQLVDKRHSGKEARYFWVGKSQAGRILTTWFTRRGERVRIIGCAEWRKFRRLYHETAKNK